MEIRKLPIGIQSFEDLRNNQYLYVDKTSYIWKMVNTGKTYFLSRPRRFGKSMLTSAIRAYFEGKKDLFHGLAIEKYENEKGSHAWISYPVLYFSLASGEYRTENGLREALEMILNKYERIYGVHAEKLNLSNRFRMDIENIYQTTGKQVVVLVDEYDKPLLDNMEINEEQEERNRQLYSDFFSALKDEDEFVKFVFITGVTKFAKVSVFSGMNQPRDISMSDEYAGICGITEKELNDLFMPEINMMAEAQNMSVEECVHSLAYMYDGYHFSKNSEGVYNPFSLFNAFEDKNFGSYWFDTGTPTFLIHKLKNSDFSPEDFSEGVEIGETQLPDYRPDNTNPIPLFFQTGYLTICGYRKRIQPGNGGYTMKFPNKEVRTGFLDMLAPYVLGSRNTDDKRPYEKMAQDIEKRGY